MKRRLATLCAALLVSASGCISRYRVEAEAPTYAAQARLSVKVNRTGNRVVRLVMIHLAPFRKIDPGYVGYAVWIVVPGQPHVLAGFLDYNRERRRGMLVASTPKSKFEVQVSLEKSKSVTAPTGKIILRKIASRS